MAGSLRAAETSPSSTKPGDWLLAPDHSAPPPIFKDRPRDPFHQGSFDFFLGSEVLVVADAHHDSLGFLELGGDYFIANGVSAGLQIGVSPNFYVVDREPFPSNLRMNIRAYSGMLIARAYLIHSPDFSFYLDGGIGGLHGEGPFPAQGVNNNWAQAIGAGITFKATGSAWWILGARYIRLSPDFFHVARNGDSNGTQCYLGISFRS
jgi:hypothetical protein